MNKILIHGGNTLNGKIQIEKSKNSILPILASTILNDKPITLHDIPNFTDIVNMCKILEHLGMKIKKENNILHITTNSCDNYNISQEYATQIRASIFTMGALLGRFRKAKLCYPGGCDIGLRPIDLHIRGLKELNVKIIEKHGNIYCDGTNMQAGKIFLDFPSVGATENIMMASVLLKGTTHIYNPAKEPEIVDLQNFINSMGGQIKGAGTTHIVINGVEKLHETEYTAMQDRIIAGTYMIATAICGGDVIFKDTKQKDNNFLINLLKKAGNEIKSTNEGIRLINKQKNKAIPIIETMPYPAFPTDLQPQMMTLQTISNGTSIIVENIFETRNKHIPELIKMGADITMRGKTAIIRGIPTLFGADVFASDLRAGAGLLLAGLQAQGYTTIHNTHHIYRGYENIDKKLNELGAKITTIS